MSDDDDGGGEMPEVLHRFGRAMRRRFHRFEGQRSEEPPYIASWTLNFQVAVGYDDLDHLWVAECLDLPGCMSQGETQEEALDNLQDAIKGVMVTIIEQKVSAGRAAAVERRQRQPKAPQDRELQERQLDMKIALGA